jgi:hypothetical protein
MDTSKYQGYLVGQVIASSIGALLLAIDDFSGYYYYDYYNKIETWGYIYLGSGVLGSILILAGIGGLLYALKASIQSLQAKDATPALIRENAEKSIQGAGFTAGLALVGAVVFVFSSLETEWWLDAGFYGAFVGGLLTVFLGREILKRLET